MTLGNTIAGVIWVTLGVAEDGSVVACAAAIGTGLGCVNTADCACVHAKMAMLKSAKIIIPIPKLIIFRATMFGVPVVVAAFAALESAT